MEVRSCPAMRSPPARHARPRASRPPRAHRRRARAQSVQTFGRKKTAVAVSYCKKGRGLIKINGCPIELVQPETLRFKVFEPILLLGRDRFANVDPRRGHHVVRSVSADSADSVTCSGRAAGIAT